MKSVLISGASIAGPVLAFWLHRFGFTPVLVERSPGPRPGGHAIDVRGAGLTVLRAMELENAARERRTRMNGVSVIGADGKEVWRSEEMTISGGDFESNSIEILREDLSGLLLSALPADLEIIFGDSVAMLDTGGVDVGVTFAHSAPRRFDLVVGADGFGSNIRNLTFGPSLDCIRPFGTALAPYSAPNHLGLENWQVSYDLGEERCLIYTARENRELRVCFAFDAALADIPSDRREQMALVRERCGSWGWEVSRLLDAMEGASDFYLGPMAQVRMPTWSKGRVALVGDAAYCPSPLTGQGTSLALVGAYVLAFELGRSPDDHATAFERYEARMRPFVLKNQAIADLSLDPRFGDSTFYAEILEPALAAAQDAIELEGI